MEKKYRIERTRKPVRAIGANGQDTTGLTDVTIVWDDEEGIGVELFPYSDVVGSIEKGVKFDTEENRNHARQVANAIQEYAKQNNIK